MEDVLFYLTSRNGLRLGHSVRRAKEAGGSPWACPAPLGGDSFTGTASSGPGRYFGDVPCLLRLYR